MYEPIDEAFLIESDWLETIRSILWSLVIARFLAVCVCCVGSCSLQNNFNNRSQRLERVRERESIMLTSHWADRQTSAARNAILGNLVWACIHLSRNMRWSTWELSGSGRHEANHHWMEQKRAHSLPFGAPFSRWAARWRAPRDSQAFRH